jgi:hypothetical protein
MLYGQPYDPESGVGLCKGESKENIRDSLLFGFPQSTYTKGARSLKDRNNKGREMMRSLKRFHPEAMNMPGSICWLE